MKKLISLLVIFLLLCGISYSQYQKAIPHSAVKEGISDIDYRVPTNTGLMMVESDPPAGTIPFLLNFHDYVTNGNNLKNLWILGDTVIAGMDNADSVNVATSSARKMYYQVSYNGGLNWLTDPVLPVASTGTAYANFIPTFLSGQRTIVLSGREFAPGSRGTSIVELAFPTGVCQSYLNPAPGRDYFAYDGGGTMIKGGYQCGDTVKYASFDYNTNSYGTPVLLAVPNDDVYQNARVFAATSPTQNRVAIAWWIASGGTAPQSLVYKESVDGGSTFGAKSNICVVGYIVNSDSVAPWFGMDLIYKPGTTQLMAAFNTLGFSGGAPNYGTRTGYKLLFWSPTINGGNPVLIADRSNVPLLMTDTAFNNNILDIQVGMTAVSHPSLAYSSDGSRLYCVYSATQRDTSNFPAGWANFNFNDIYLSYSNDNGATWSGPYFVTNTPQDDEIYPTISPTGNVGNYIHVSYHSSKYPGSAQFSDLSYTGRTYRVYKKLDITTLPPVGIREIGVTTVPASFTLKQNFPNPFNPETRIQFNIAKAGFVSLKVYDAVGREVTTLVNMDMRPGAYEVMFDGRGLASGMYFYTMRANGYVETKKMMLVK